jgi:hypothetical protein
LYKTPLDIFLIAAKIIKPEQTINFTKPNILNGIMLTEEEEKLLLHYLQFLRYGMKTNLRNEPKYKI